MRSRGWRCEVWTQFGDPRPIRQTVTKVAPLLLFLLLAGCEPSHPGTTVARSEVRRVAPEVARPTEPPTAGCPEKPNILLVSIDTLRFDATALDRLSKNDTPFLRELRTVGINFGRCYSTHDSTPPSHFSMLTGFVNGLQTDIDTPEISLAHQLRRLGYRTFGVSANGNLSPASMRCLTRFRHFTNLYDEWQKLPPQRKAALTRKIDARLTAYGYEQSDWNRMVLFSSFSEVIAHVTPLLSGTQPFFGFINLMDVHDPYLPDPRRYDRRREEDGTVVPDLRYRKLPSELTDPKSIPDARRREEIMDMLRKSDGRAWSIEYGLDRAAIRAYRKRYLAEVRELDDSLRELFRRLADAKLTDSTIVIITSDHGESFGEKHLLTHSFDDGGDMNATHHVPLLLIFPRCYGYGARTIDGICTIADIPPTLYEMLAIDAEPIWVKALPGTFGRSLLPLLGSSQSPRMSVATEPIEPIDPSRKQQQDDEARKRLRSLGYIH